MSQLFIILFFLHIVQTLNVVLILFHKFMALQILTSCNG